MHAIYNLFIGLYRIILRFLALFNQKIDTMLKGQKRCFDVLKTIPSNKKIVWFHCASLGEFEQGRPLIERLKETNPEYKVLLSFYSPSGFEIRKDYSFADWVVYLPDDSESNAKRFVSLVNPYMTFFVKYEFWYNYLIALKGRRVFQVSLIMRPSQYFFKPYGKWFAQKLGVFEHFFVQNNQTKDLLNSIGYKNVTISGDTRFDRVIQISRNTKSFPEIEKFFSKDKKTLLAGSSWEADETIIASAFKQRNDLKLIIAPHLVDKNHIASIQNLFPESVLYSEVKTNDLSKYSVLIIDCIGILSSLYKYCDIAYIGGGFGAGIHNTLEAATFGKPICFGKRYNHFQEAVDLVEREAAFAINNSEELSTILNRLCDDDVFYNNAAIASVEYTNAKAGACDRIFNYLHL